MFEKTENNYIFILAIWVISITATICLHSAGHNLELRESIKNNIYLVPQFQMFAYSAYLGMYLFVTIQKNLNVPKCERSVKNAIILVAKSATTTSIAFIDLVMITVLTFSVFTAVYGIGDNIPYNWHMLFLHVIAPLLALFMTWNLRNQKIKLREPIKLSSNARRTPI